MVPVNALATCLMCTANSKFLFTSEESWYQYDSWGFHDLYVLWSQHACRDCIPSTGSTNQTFVLSLACDHNYSVQVESAQSLARSVVHPPRSMPIRTDINVYVITSMIYMCYFLVVLWYFLLFIFCSLLLHREHANNLWELYPDENPCPRSSSFCTVHLRSRSISAIVWKSDAITIWSCAFLDVNTTRRGRITSQFLVPHFQIIQTWISSPIFF